MRHYDDEGKLSSLECDECGVQTKPGRPNIDGWVNYGVINLATQRREFVKEFCPKCWDRCVRNER